ncbi:MAG: DUF4214 domain-containing protein [Limnobacter sp.]|nr:DUF4214 domain-containing protein [Limnobacter sp.]
MAVSSTLTNDSDKVQAIYNAFYGRPADPDGLAFWVGRLQAAGGDLKAILPAFGNSAESNALYGLNSPSAAVVTKIYNIILGRNPDAAGLNFYINKLDSGELTRSEVAFAVFDGINPNDSVDGALTLNKLRVANAFTFNLENNPSFDLGYQGEPAAIVGRDLLQQASRSGSDTNDLLRGVTDFMQERLVDNLRGVAADPFDFELVFSNAGARNNAALFQAAFDKLETFFFKGLPSYTNPADGRTYDDLRVSISVRSIDGESGTVGFAGPDFLRPDGDQLPFLGSMVFDSADISSLIADGIFDEVVIHEALHILGFGTLWPERDLNLVSGRYNGTQGVLEYRALTGNENLTFVPLEQGAGEGSDDAHWLESLFQAEIMTAFVDNNAPFARLSLAGLEDLGYDLNYSKAEFFAL